MPPCTVRSRRVSNQAMQWLRGIKVSAQVLKPIGCAFAIPARLEALLQGGNVDAGPLMGLQHRDRERRAYPARVAAQGRNE